VPGTALNWANIRVIRHFGTHLTCQDLPCGAVDSRRIYTGPSLDPAEITRKGRADRDWRRLLDHLAEVAPASIGLSGKN
jgi:hypothetical protein